jgi:hypothetical protein
VALPVNKPPADTQTVKASSQPKAIFSDIDIFSSVPASKPTTQPVNKPADTENIFNKPPADTQTVKASSQPKTTNLSDIDIFSSLPAASTKPSVTIDIFSPATTQPKPVQTTKVLDDNFSSPATSTPSKQPPKVDFSGIDIFSGPTSTPVAKPSAPKVDISSVDIFASGVSVSKPTPKVNIDIDIFGSSSTSIPPVAKTAITKVNVSSLYIFSGSA